MSTDIEARNKALWFIFKWKSMIKSAHLYSFKAASYDPEATPEVEDRPPKPPPGGLSLLRGKS